jgi:AcrR family transcriptional regulator
MNDDNPPKPKPQKDKRRALDQVLQIALEEIKLRGAAGMRVADVAARARCSTETIYEAFQNKDSLIREALLQEYRSTAGPRIALMTQAGPAINVLHGALLGIAFECSQPSVQALARQLAGADANMITPKDRELIGADLEALKTGLTDLLKRGAKEGDILEGMAQTTMARWLVSNVLSGPLMHGMLIGGVDRDRPPLDLVLDLLTMVATDKGKKQLASLDKAARASGDFELPGASA